jgi:hypothetical protein
MPSTYSPDLRIELIATGEQSGTWGSTTNSNLGTIIEDAISGLASVSITSADQALTAVNGAADQSRCAAISLTTTTGAPFNVYVPPVTKLYVVNNASGQTATVFCSTVLGNTTAAGTGVAIPTGKSVLLRSTGVNIEEQLNYIAGNLQVGGNLAVTGSLSANSAALATALPVTSGGTGQTSFTDGQLLIGNTSGNTLTKSTLTAGTGVSVTNGAGSVTLANTGVTALTAGTGISLSGSTGNVTVSTTGGATSYVFNAYTSPATWTKPAGLSSIKVTVVGAGGNGGDAPATPGGAVAGTGGGGGGGGSAIYYVAAPSLPGPVSVTAGGGTNSFGVLVSATAGGNGGNLTFPSVSGTPGAAGVGSGGTLSFKGSNGFQGSTGGSSIFGGSTAVVNPGVANVSGNGVAGANYGGGGSGAFKNSPPAATSNTGGAGAPGVVIVEEFY